MHMHKIFTIDQWGNYPTIMVDPPVEYLCIKMCNFPRISPLFFPGRSFFAVCTKT